MIRAELKCIVTGLGLAFVTFLPTDLSAQGTSGFPSIHSSVSDTMIWAGTTLRIRLSAIDASGSAISVVAQSIPTDASFGEQSGAFAWTPDKPQIQELLFSATDTQGGRTIKSIVIAAKGELFPGTFGEALFDSLRANYSPAATLGYDIARDSMYAVVDLQDDGFVRGIYTGYAVPLIEGDPSTVMFNGGINAENVWPQSMGAGDEPQKSDLHNLYPAKSNVNSSRSNKPFGEIVDAEADTWYRLDEVLTTIPEFDRDEYSESKAGRWEPRESVEGDIARAVFYFATMYSGVVDELFLPGHTGYLQNWIGQDPATPTELRRSLTVERLQGNINPFLLDEILSFRLFGLVESTKPKEELPYSVSIDVFPNPILANVNIQISNQTLKYGSVTLFDILGRAVSTAFTIQPYSERSYILDARHLSSGLYFVVLISDDRTISRSFIVQK